jgi:uncharacterized repeat protein (TIGR03809 family)
MEALARTARVASQWRDLADRRRGYFIDLFESGRWKHYYGGQEFLEELRRVHAHAERWAEIAFRSEQLAASALVEAPRPKAAA